MSASRNVRKALKTATARGDQLSTHKNATRIYVRLVFLRIGEIDTLNEKYQAQASIECRWKVPAERISSIFSPDDQKRLADGKSISLNKYAETHWHPQLYIENALGDLKEVIKYSAKQSEEDNEIYICEHRDIKGLFWEKLELQHFPSDVQDLSISVASMLYDDKIVLTPDPNRLSGVNREAFVDQQEWSLYEHVDSEERFIKEFLFRTAEDEEDENPGDKDAAGGGGENRKRSVVTVTCHAARQSDYFFWNGYCLIFLITSVSFCTFGMPMQVAINRLQVSCTLLLTSITFRWTINRSLPTVSYLTTMDKYGFLCILNLVFHSIWHGIISKIAWIRTPDYRVPGDSWIANLDHGAFYVLISCYVAFHVAVISWIYFVPLKHRRKMKKNDELYRASVIEKMSGSVNKSFKHQEKELPGTARIPIENQTG